MQLIEKAVVLYHTRISKLFGYLMPLLLVVLDPIWIHLLHVIGPIAEGVNVLALPDWEV